MHAWLIFFIVTLCATAAETKIENDFTLTIESRSIDDGTVPTLELTATYHGDTEILLDVDSPLAEHTGVSKPAGWELLSDSSDGLIDHIFEMRPPRRMSRGDKVSGSLKLEDYFRRIAPGSVELLVTLQLRVKGPGEPQQFEIESTARVDITQAQAETFNREAEKRAERDKDKSK